MKRVVVAAAVFAGLTVTGMGVAAAHSSGGYTPYPSYTHTTKATTPCPSTSAPSTTTTTSTSPTSPTTSTAVVSPSSPVVSPSSSGQTHTDVIPSGTPPHRTTAAPSSHGIDTAVTEIHPTPTQQPDALANTGAALALLVAAGLGLVLIGAGLYVGSGRKEH